MDEHARKKKVANEPKKPRDMGQGSHEESFAGKGPSKSKQGPKKVLLKKNRS
jgi:hypothetical protein